MASSVGLLQDTVPRAQFSGFFSVYPLLRDLVNWAFLLWAINLHSSPALKSHIYSTSAFGCLISILPLMWPKENFLTPTDPNSWKKKNKTFSSGLASGPITSWQIDGETVETVADFIFLGSKITADGDCSHEIKRRLLLGKLWPT